MVRVAIERIKDHLELDQEAPARSQTPPPARWPSSDGGISIENLVVRYAQHLRPVLRRINFTINPREKIGVVSLSPPLSRYLFGLVTKVGRTGSGKVSLRGSCWRMLKYCM